MINLLVHTEYSFRYAYGKLKDIVAQPQSILAITDRYTTFGHIPFYKACKKAKKKAILGVELAFVDDATLKVKQNPSYITLLAINQKGLSQIYELVSKSTQQRYYYNRLSKGELYKVLEKNVVIIFKERNLEQYFAGRSNTYFGVTAITPYTDAIATEFPLLAISDNLYDTVDHEKLYHIIMGNGQFETSSHMRHLLTESEWRQEVYFLPKEYQDKAIMNTEKIANQIESFSLDKAELPIHTEARSLLELCLDGAKKRGCDLTRSIYKDRLERELDLISKKNFEGYFYLVWDLVNWAKQHMLVGPARGSSAGSLVCYLLFITDVDPIPFNLIFERFIDINRLDLPDIDIDFQDTKREMLIDYLKEKYGHKNVAKLGTVSKYKPKSILGELAKMLNIPPFEVKDLKNAIPERSGGDARANNCIEDTFRDLEIGKEFLKKYPNMIYAQEIESHNRHFGQHAAAIVVANKPLDNYCSHDYSVDGCMLDKKDAEEINLLKMDCLGLRTLTVIQTCLDLIGKDREWLINYRLDDQKAFDIVNERKFSGIFQFEGFALINIAKQIHIKELEDIAAIEALARPGPLVSVGANKYIVAKNDPSKIHYMPKCEEYTKDTYGVVVYQEQVMNIVRNVGALSWEDTSELRKAMSKSLGDEFFNQYKGKFVSGAKAKHGMDEDSSLQIWNNVNSMGSWAFNKSHAVSYGLISYYCMVLKAYWPLEFALATLKNAKDDEQAVNILKELSNEGYKFKTFDKELSEIDWSIKDNMIIGGFINIKGIGPKKAEGLIKKRREGIEFTAAERKMMYNAITPYDNIFEFREKMQQFYDNWQLFFKIKPQLIIDIEMGEEVRFLAKTVSTSLRDMNEEILIKKRNGKVITEGCTSFLDLKFIDDTDTVQGRINAELFEKFGRQIMERDKVGSYYLVNGFCCKDFKYIIVKNIKLITVETIEQKIKEMKDGTT
jgi:DNA polymerase III alpha subunit